MKDTKSTELGGVLTRTRSNSRQRPESRGPISLFSRGRSISSRQDNDAKDAQSSDGKVGRSRSRMGKGLLKKMRSLSRRRKYSPDAPRGRSDSRGPPQRGFEHLERPDVRGRRRDIPPSGARNSVADQAPQSRTAEVPPRPDAKHTSMTVEVEEIPRDDNENGDIPQMVEKVSKHARTPQSSTDESIEDQHANDDEEDKNNDDIEDEDEDEDVIDNNVGTTNDNEIDINDGQTPANGRHGAERESILGSDSDSESDEEENGSEGEENALSQADVMNLDKKNTQMHVACLLHYPSKDIVCQLKLDNSLAFKPNSAGELPLHYAMMDKKGVNDEVLLTLLNLNPDAVQYPNAHRSLPIHLACLSGGAKKDAIRALVSMCPDSVMVRSKFPVPFEPDMLDNVDTDDSESEDDEEAAKQPESAVASNSFFDLIGYGSQAPPPPPPPASTSEKKKLKKKICVDDELTRGKQMYETGWTPLHLAIINGAESAIIELLVSANPQCVFVKTNRGRMPIDCAQYMVRQHWLYGTDDETTVQKTFAAIELLEETAIDHR